MSKSKKLQYVFPDKEGWVQITHLCGSHRRGLWVRLEEKTIEFKSGREGDDDYICMPLGKADTNHIGQLIEVLNTAEWGIAYNGPVKDSTGKEIYTECRERGQMYIKGK